MGFASDQLVCPRCGSVNPPAGNYCAQCGILLSGPIVQSTTRVTPLMTQWRLLSHAMTRKDVRKLLGEPARIEVPVVTVPTFAEIWHYEYEVVGRKQEKVRGSVLFSPPEGRILRWIEPEWGELG